MSAEGFALLHLALTVVAIAGIVFIGAAAFTLAMLGRKVAPPPVALSMPTLDCSMPFKATCGFCGGVVLFRHVANVIEVDVCPRCIPPPPPAC